MLSTDHAVNRRQAKVLNKFIQYTDDIGGLQILRSIITRIT